MTKKRLIERIVLYELIGFAGIVLILWFDEIWDWPHRFFGAGATPVNWRESSVESLLVLVLAVLVVVTTRRILGRMKYLEGFILFCAGCKRVRVDGRWISPDVFVRDYSDAHISHGLCPDCLERYAGARLKG